MGAVADMSERLASDEVARPQADERLLLSRHLKGDREAFPELVARFGSLIYTVVGRYGLSAEERDDVFQEVFVRVHRAAPGYQADRELKPWLLTIAVNTARSYLSRSRGREVSDRGQASLRLVSDQPTSQQLVEASRTLTWLVTRLDELPVAQREVLLLCCVHHLEMQQAADVLGIPLGTVKTHLRKGRLALAADLERRRHTQEREVGR